MSNTPYLDQKLIQDDQIKQFKAEGLIHLKGLIEMKWVKMLQEIVDQLYLESTPGSFFCKSDVWKTNQEVANFIKKSPVAKIVAELLESHSLRLYEDTIMVKWPGARATPWHQDQVYYHVNGRQVATLWLSLDKATQSNGCLKYIKGSHLWNKWYSSYASFSRDSEIVEEFEPITNFDEAHHLTDRLICEAEAGDCIVHHGLTLHSSFPSQEGALPRRAIAFGFTGDDTTYAPRRFKYQNSHLVNLEPGMPLDSDLFPRVYPRE